MGEGWLGAANRRLASGAPSSVPAGTPGPTRCFQGRVLPPAHFLGNLGHSTRNPWRVIVVDAINHGPLEAPWSSPRRKLLSAERPHSWACWGSWP